MVTMTNSRYITNRLEAHERPAYIYVYYVTGRVSFPTDMLRYDRAWPATTDDALSITNHSISISGKKEIHSIRLHSHQPPTIDRWSSFGWSVGKENLR